MHQGQKMQIANLFFIQIDLINIRMTINELYKLFIFTHFLDVVITLIYIYICMYK